MTGTNRPSTWIIHFAVTTMHNMHSKRNILITGANRGLGLGFVQHYLSLGDRVWATYRHDAAPLVRLDDVNCQPLHWDVTGPLHETEIAKLPYSIDLLINNAGIYGAKNGGQSLQEVTEEALMQVFNVNVVAPVKVVQFLLPRLQRGKATIVNMGSKMGSVNDNSSGGAYAYRASKSALCNVTKSMALDLQKDGIQALCLHPGWVRTDMGGESGLIDVETSIAGLTSVIDRVEDYVPGSFVAYDGVSIPY